jgi:hypothetical protein
MSIWLMSASAAILFHFTSPSPWMLRARILNWVVGVLGGV